MKGVVPRRASSETLLAAPRVNRDRCRVSSSETAPRCDGGESSGKGLGLLAAPFLTDSHSPGRDTGTRWDSGSTRRSKPGPSVLKGVAATSPRTCSGKGLEACDREEDAGSGVL